MQCWHHSPDSRRAGPLVCGFSNKTKTQENPPQPPHGYPSQPLKILTAICSPAGKAQLPDKDLKELEGQLKAREELLLPIYHQVAVQFADLHDTPGHMLEKGIISVRVLHGHHRDAEEYVGVWDGSDPGLRGLCGRFSLSMSAGAGRRSFPYTGHPHL